MAKDDRPIEDWAMKRVKELHLAAGGAVVPMAHAFARYIAEHEEAPVDPLLIEARKIVETFYTERNWAGDNVIANKIKTGNKDEDAEVKQALAALKRGIELGKAST